jgi:hypothetical protein
MLICIYFSPNELQICYNKQLMFVSSVTSKCKVHRHFIFDLRIFLLWTVFMEPITLNQRLHVHFLNWWACNEVHSLYTQYTYSPRPWQLECSGLVTYSCSHRNWTVVLKQMNNTKLNSEYDTNILNRLHRNFQTHVFVFSTAPFLVLLILWLQAPPQNYLLQIPRLLRGINAVPQKNPQYFIKWPSNTSRYRSRESPFFPLNNSVLHLLPSINRNAVLIKDEPISSAVIVLTQSTLGQSSQYRAKG